FGSQGTTGRTGARIVRVMAGLLLLGLSFFLWNEPSRVRPAGTKQVEAAAEEVQALQSIRSSLWSYLIDPVNTVMHAVPIPVINIVLVIIGLVLWVPAWLFYFLLSCLAGLLWCLST